MPPPKIQKKGNAGVDISRRLLLILCVSLVFLWDQLASRYLLGERIESIGSNNKEWPPADQIKAITDSDNTVILIAVNFDNVDFADNLITSIQSFGVESFVLLPLDSKAHAVLLQYYPKNTIPQFPGVGNIEASLATYGSVNFKHIAQLRPRFILSFLERGVNVLYNDADMVWKSNILEDMKSKLNNNGVLLDAVIADDRFQSKSCKTSFNFCTCNMLFATTESSKQLMKRWEQYMNENQSMENQIAFNTVLSNMRKKSSFKFNCLGDHDGYPSGFKYFKRDNDEQRATAKIVHNNYIKGKPNKLQRFQQYGLWNPGAIGQTKLSHPA